MTSKELRRLSRQELLELLVQQKQENESLQEKVEELETVIVNRSIRIGNAGSLAKAALELNEVFEKADKAAELYLENIKRCSEQQDSMYEEIVAEAEKKAAETAAAAEQKAQELTAQAEQKAQEMLEAAEAEKQQKMKEIDAYWKGLQERLEAFYQSHPGLKEVLEKSSQK